MAKYLTVSELTGTNEQLRKQTSEITRRAARARDDLERARTEAEQRYAELPPNVRREYVGREIASSNGKIVADFEQSTKGILRDVLALAAQINEARELYENPFKRLNILTAMEPKMAARRAEVTAMVRLSGPAEIETLAEAFRSTGDFGGLAAIISKNMQLPSADRKLTNAAIVAGVVFPHSDQVTAIMRDAAELPELARQETRRVVNAGKISGVDRIRSAFRVVGVDGEGELTTPSEARP
jgi:hypothetical protein